MFAQVSEITSSAIKHSEKVTLFSLRTTGSMIFRMMTMTLFDPRYDEQHTHVHSHPCDQAPHHLNTSGPQKTRNLGINGGEQSVLRSSCLIPNDRTLRACCLHISIDVWWWVRDKYMTLLGTDSRPLSHVVSDWGTDVQILLCTNNRSKLWNSRKRRKSSISRMFIIS